MKDDLQNVKEWRVLSSKPCIKVLRLLARSSVPLHGRKIAKKLEMKGGYLHRSLRQLVDVGFIKREKTGHWVFYEVTQEGREAWKNHQALSALQNFGLPKALKELEARFEEIEARYPSRQRLTDKDKCSFAHQIMTVSGHVLISCFNKEFVLYAMNKLPEYRRLMIEASHILEADELNA